MDLKSRRSIFASGLLLIVALTPISASAMNRKSIIFRAAGSGALIGVGAGVISYPFAKSSGTIVAGALVGALLGTVYGVHLANLREEQYASSGDRLRNPLSEFAEADRDRRERLARDGRASHEVFLPLGAVVF